MPTKVSEADTKSRLATTLQGFHQIVALSQNNINASFKFLAISNKLFKEIEIDIEGEVYFFLNFIDGSFTWWTGHGPSSKEHKTSVKDWILAFSVNVNLEEMEKNKVPQVIKDKLKKPESYSIKQLLLDFQTADLAVFDIQRSSTPGISLEKGQNIDEKAYLNTYLSKYLEHLVNGSHNILGYAANALEPLVANPEAPTFPPTNVQLQTYSYHPGGDHNAITAPGLNMFFFLEMTNGIGFPPGVLNWRGNWLTPDLAGTMAISRENFWEHYLLKKSAIESINKLSMVTVASSEGWPIKLMYMAPGPERSDVSWKRSKDTSQGAYVFDYTSEGKHKFDIIAMAGDNGIRTNTHNRWDWTPGSNIITCKGTVNVYQWISLHSSISHQDFVDVTVNFKFSLTLSSVHDGGLEVTASEPEIEPPKFVTGGNHIGELTNMVAHTSDKAAQSISNLLTKGLHPESWASDITNALNGQQHFVFPGGGTFDMKNPIFNKEGDLLIGLTYRQG